MKNIEKMQELLKSGKISLKRIVPFGVALFATVTVATAQVDAKTVDTNPTAISYKEDDVTDFIKEDFDKIKKEVEAGVYMASTDKNTNMARILAVVTERYEYYLDLIKGTDSSYKENINKALQVYINDIYLFFSATTDISLEELAKFENENYCDLVNNNSVIAYKYDSNGNIDKNNFVDYSTFERTASFSNVSTTEPAPTENNVQATYTANPGDISLIGVSLKDGSINFNVPFMSNSYADEKPVYSVDLKNYNLGSSDYQRLQEQIKNIDAYYNTLYTNLNNGDYNKTSNDSSIIKFLGDLNYINRTVYTNFFSENETVRGILDTYLKNRKAVAIKDFSEKTNTSHMDVMNNYDNQYYYVLWTDTNGLPELKNGECYVAQVKKGANVELKNVKTLFVVNETAVSVKTPNFENLPINAPSLSIENPSNTANTNQTFNSTVGGYVDESGNPIDVTDGNITWYTNGIQR